MSAFEKCCWNWYWLNVTPFALEAGSVDRLIARLRLRAIVERFFVRGLNLVRQYDLKNRIEDQKQ